MKKFLIITLCIAASGIYSCTKEVVDEYAIITFIIGDVKKNSAGVSMGDVIKEKDEIITAADSFCDVKIGGSIIRIKENSKVIVSSLVRKDDLESTTLGMDVGKMLCKPKKLIKSESFIVKTPTAVAGVRGTNFIVEADKLKTTRIKVFEGKVQIAKRIKQFEGSVEKVLEVAQVLEKERKVIITAQDVKKVEDTVDKIIKAGKVTEINSVITKVKDDAAISKESMQSFKVEDFAKESKEIIAVQPKPKDVIQRLVKVIAQEKEMPKPDGRLLITRYEIYFIKNGKVMWEGNVVENPLSKDNRLYIASGDYVFCASSDGPVLWRKNIRNNGKLKIVENSLIINTEGKEAKLDLETGERL